MPDIGSQLRDYYESIVEQVDVEDAIQREPGRGTRSRSGWRGGWRVAVVAAIVTFLVFGLAVLIRPDPTPPAEPPASTSVPTTEGQGEITEELAPTVLLLADGTEVTSITELGPVFSERTYESLASFALTELTDDRYWPGETSGSAALGLNPISETGLEVELTVDPAIQQTVEDVINKWRDDPSTFINVVVVDNGSGDVLAAAPAFQDGGSDFRPARLQMPVGSLAQVYTTVAALEAGYAVDSTWDSSSPQTFTLADGTEWTVNSPSGEGQVTLEEALYRALDTVFAGVAVEIGAESIIETAERLGVTVQPPFPDPPPSVATGSGTITTFDAAAMFATLTRGGVRTDLNLIKSITNSVGQVIYQSSPPTEPTVDADIIEEVNMALELVPTKGTAIGAMSSYPELAFNSMGKTGTANEHAAAWYVGATDRHTIAVSVTRADQTPLLDVTFNGQMYARVFGGSVPAPIWAEIASQLP